MTFKEFENQVINSPEPVLVDFYASWCAPCKMLNPILKEAESELNGKAKIIKIDVDKAEEVAKKYGVMSIPTMVVISNKEEKERLVGLKNKKTILDAINKYL